MLRSNYGLEGYGVFWMIIETMHSDTTGYINKEAIPGLAISFGIQPDKLKSIFDSCVGLDLFKICDHGNYYSDRVLDQKSKIVDYVENGRLGGLTKWKNIKNQTVTTPLLPGVATPLLPSKLNESKVNESKEENIKKRECDFVASLNNFTQYDSKLRSDFQRYWTEPNKSGKKMRFELERTWDMSRRLITWESRSNSYGNKAAGAGQRHSTYRDDGTRPGECPEPELRARHATLEG